MKVPAFITSKLTAASLEAALKSGAEAIITNGIAVKVPDRIRVIDANEYRVEGSHYAYLENEKLFREKLQKIWPRVARWKGVDLTSAFLKGLYWSNRTVGALLVTAEKYGHDIDIMNHPPLHYGNPIKAFISWSRIYFANLGGFFVTAADSELINAKEKVGFVLGSFEQFLFLQPVMNSLLPEKSLVVLPPGNKLTEVEKDAIRRTNRVVVMKESKRLFCPVLRQIPLSSKEGWLVREIVRLLPEVSNALNWGTRLMKDKSLKVIVTVAQENTPTGHILCKLAEQNGKRVVNVMNGIKLGTANDRNAEFNCWIVWDEQMKKVLVEKSQLKPEMLAVAGNLNQDKIRSHQYGHSLPLEEDDLRNKLLISIISTRDRRKDKIEALDTIYGWANGKKNVIILYRTHPSEKEEDYYLPKTAGINLKLIRQTGAAAKTGLFDQLAVSGLVINFGSTVSLEAKMMGTPVVTYELKDKSMLYCVDNKTIFHVNTPAALLAHLHQLEDSIGSPGPRWTNSEVSKSVSTAYADIIESMIA